MLCTLRRLTLEPHIATMMFAHAGLPKRLALDLVLRGPLWTLNTTYKHQIRFTHVKVMFLATSAQAVFFFPSKAKHLHHNRRIWPLWRPNMYTTSKPSVGLNCRVGSGVSFGPWHGTSMVLGSRTSIVHTCLRTIFLRGSQLFPTSPIREHLFYFLQLNFSQTT